MTGASRSAALIRSSEWMSFDEEQRAARWTVAGDKVQPKRSRIVSAVRATGRSWYR
jgi:hypothetical protein